MIPMFFLPNIPERLEGNEQIPEEVKVEESNVNSKLKKEKKKKTKDEIIATMQEMAVADNSEEDVFNCLARYGQDQWKKQFMCVFHGFKLTKKILKEFQNRKIVANGANDANAKDANAKDANDTNAKDANANGANDTNAKDANANGANNTNANDANANGANGTNAKDANAKDANANGANDANANGANDTNAKDANAKDANGANDTNANDANAKDANGANDTNANDAKDANGANDTNANDAKDANGANDTNAKDAKGHGKQTKEFDFFILSDNFVAVVEVKGLTKFSKRSIGDGCSQLRQGEEFLKWVIALEGIVKKIEVKKILCLPMLVENCEGKRKGVDIICNTGEGFEKNLRMVLDSYTLESSKLDELSGLTKDELGGLSRRLAEYYFSGHELNENKTDWRLYTPGHLISVIDSRVKIQDVRKGMKRDPPVIGFVNTKQKSQEVRSNNETNQSKPLESHCTCVECIINAYDKGEFEVPPSEKFLPRFITPHMKCGIDWHVIINAYDKGEFEVPPSEKFLPRFVTPQQRIANGRKRMILIGAAGTGKTLLIKAKVEDLTTSGEKVIIVPATSNSLANYADCANNKNVQIWTQEYLEEEFKLDTIAKDLYGLPNRYKYTDSRKRVLIMDENQETVMVRKNFSHIIGMYIGRVSNFEVDFGAADFFEYEKMSHLLESDQLEKYMSEANKTDAEKIENQILQGIVRRLEKNWNLAKVKLYKIFDDNHFFMDDMFSSSAQCFDILSYFVLEYLNEKTTLYKVSVTKYLWIAGDPYQLIFNVPKYTFHKFFISFMDEQSNIHMATMHLDAVFRCSKNVFQEWKSFLDDIKSYLCLNEVLKETFSKVESVDNDKYKWHTPNYGYHYAGRSIALPNFKSLKDLVKDIRDRITFLTNDKSLGNSNFAVLCCVFDAYKIDVLNVIECRFQDLGIPTQSISEFNKNTKNERQKTEQIILDLADNSVGLEWAVVFVIRTDIQSVSNNRVAHNDELYEKDISFEIQNYLACSRCRVLLHLYLLEGRRYNI